MPMSRENVTPSTPPGANLTNGGATFRGWAPRANEVHVIGQFSGQVRWTPDDSNLMNQDNRGYWTGFLPGVVDGEGVRKWSIISASRGS